MSAPLVSADDRGLTLGVGLFETILFVDGAPRSWNAHVDRLRRGCAELGLPPPSPSDLELATTAAVAAANLANGRAAVRLTLTGGPGERGLAGPPAPTPRLLALASRAAIPPAGLSLATASIRRNPSSPTSRLKTLSYLDNVAARREAVAAGADEALLLDTAGHVSCAAGANIFWVEGDRLCTPALTCGVLPGVVRAQVLAAAPGWNLEPAELESKPDRLLSADGAIVTNSVIGGVAVLAVDGRSMGQKMVQLQEAVAALVR